MDKKSKLRIPCATITKIAADPGLGKPFAFQVIHSKKNESVILAAQSNAVLQVWVSTLESSKL
jgi:hypothetical protein